MIDSLHRLDTEIFLFFNGLNHDIVDPFMATVSGRWIWVPMYLAIAACVVWRYGWKRGVIVIAAACVAVGVADFVCASVIRPVIGRLRPANIENPISYMVHVVNDYRGGRFGFPSCHAANTFALAVFTALQFRVRRYSVFIFVWTALLCYSRIYLGVHYPGDILAGAVVGSAAATALYFSIRRFVGKEEDRHATLRPVYITAGVTVLYVFAEMAVRSL